MDATGENDHLGASGIAALTLLIANAGMLFIAVVYEFCADTDW